MEFPIAQEMPDGTQAWLLKLRDSKLQDEILLEEFYEKFIKNYAYGETTIHRFTRPMTFLKKAEDGMEMFDASDDVYEYLMCSIAGQAGQGKSLLQC